MIEDNLYDLEFVDDGTKHRVKLTKVVEDDTPTLPPPIASNAFLKKITSDDGQSTAYVLDQSGTFSLDADIDCPETAIFVTAKGNVTLDLNGHTINFGRSSRDGCAGIQPIKGFSRHGIYGKNDLRFRNSLPNLSYANRILTVKNGNITYAGNDKAQYICGVGANYSFSVKLNGVRIFAAGTDAASVYLNNLTVEECFLLVSSQKTNNRHQIPANVKVTGMCFAHNNIVLGGNSGFSVGSDSIIKTNLIRHNSFATNGYGGNFYECENILFKNNIVAPTNGRGVIMGGSPSKASGYSPLATNIVDNIIYSIEKPNAEYGHGLEPNCIRSRYDVQNLYVGNNDCLAIGGSTARQAYTAALGLYITNKPGFVSNVIEYNTFSSVLLGDMDLVNNKLAAPIGLIGQGKTKTDEHGEAYINHDTIRKNHLQSNNVMFCLSHTDGGCNMSSIHCHELIWKSGRDILSEFLRKLLVRVRNFETPFTEARDNIAADINRQFYSYQSEPEPVQPQRAYCLVGRWMGSKVNIKLEKPLSTQDRAIPVIRRWFNTYEYAVTLEGIQHWGE